jgi:hypothetical protein
MSRYLVKRIRESKYAKESIREFRKEILGNMGELVGDYLTTPGVTCKNAKCALIFAGIGTGQKGIDFRRMLNLMENDRKEKDRQFKELLKGVDPRNLSAIPEAKVRSIVECIDNSQQAIKDVVGRGIDQGKPKGSLLQIPVTDQLIFAVEINSESANPFKFKDCEWGDYLVYGGGLGKDMYCQLNENFTLSTQFALR